MYSCNIDHDDYKHNGLITKIWGGPGWIFNHSVTFGYPINPTDVQNINTNYGVGRKGTLSDGNTIISRPGSKDGRPTLEIQKNGRSKDEIRYN